MELLKHDPKVLPVNINSQEQTENTFLKSDIGIVLDIKTYL